VLVNLFADVFGPVVALIIYLVFLSRSKYVAYHAMQSFLFQLVVWYGIGVMWGIVGMSCAVLIGIVLIPLCLYLDALPPVWHGHCPYLWNYRDISDLARSGFQVLADR